MNIASILEARRIGAIDSSQRAQLRVAAEEALCDSNVDQFEVKLTTADDATPIRSTFLCIISHDG